LKYGSFADWEQRWRTGALATAQAAGEHLANLGDGDLTHLAEADIHVLAPPATQRLGMCGRLNVYDPAAGTSPHD
jgi:hypothetical protein